MIIWIASYPKSGNTWIRSFISSLLYSNDGTNDFSNLDKIKQFPDRSLFKNFVDDFQNIEEVYKNWLKVKNYISENFKFAFGQHSGVIDLNKDKYELPRFPINEKYGEISRFENLVKYLPLQYNYITPEDKLIKAIDNPPNMIINFFAEQKNLDKISCYSNEGGTWEKTNIELENNKLNIFFREKFNDRRGRINCSLKDVEGWRWLGIQFSIN